MAESPFSPLPDIFFHCQRRIVVSRESEKDKKRNRKRRYKKEPMSREKKLIIAIIFTVIFVAAVFGLISMLSENLNTAPPI